MAVAFARRRFDGTANNPAGDRVGNCFNLAH
jgi:hypothetical protein